MRIYRERDMEYSFESGSVWVFKNQLDKQYTGPLITWNDKLNKEIRYFAGTVMNWKTESANELVKNSGYGNLIYDTIKEEYVEALPEPEEYNWQISKKDKKKGFVTRYFMESQKGKITELSKQGYGKFAKSEAVYIDGMHLEKIIQFLDHSRIELNLLAIKKAEKNIKNIRTVIGCMDALQQQVSQYTSGDTYMLDEEETMYTGYFNVMSGLGLFTGRYYTKDSKMLIPVDWGNEIYIPKGLVPK